MRPLIKIYPLILVAISLPLATLLWLSLDTPSSPFQQHSQSSTPNRSDDLPDTGAFPADIPPPPPAAQEQAGNSIVLSPSLLGLHLLALFQTQAQTEASAVILDELSGAYRYKVGESPRTGLKIAAILPDRVLLQSSDSVVALHLVPVSAVTSDDHNHTDAVAEPFSAPLYESEESQKRRAQLTELDFQPISTDSPNGYRIGKDFPEEAATTSGLQPGDILLSVNGYPVGEASNDDLVSLSFGPRGQAVLLVERKGQLVTIHYPEDVLTGKASEPQS